MLQKYLFSAIYITNESYNSFFIEACFFISFRTWFTSLCVFLFLKWHIFFVNNIYALYLHSQNNKVNLFFEGRLALPIDREVQSFSKISGRLNKGRLAQLVQSICLTSRGSLVRTQYLPPNDRKPFKQLRGFFVFSG